MSDLRPLLDGGATELEAALLLEAQKEQPSPEALARTMRSLAAAGAVVAASAAVASTTQATATATGVTSGVFSILAKSFGVVAIVGGIAAGVIHWRGTSTATETKRAEPPPVATALAPDHDRAASGPKPRSPSGSVVASSPSTEASNAVEAPADEIAPSESAPSAESAAPERAAALVPSASRAPVESSARSLAPEIALIDQARAALKAGKPAQALAILQRYRSQFGEGRLAPEANVLRIEAMMATGDRKAAEALAQKSLGTDAQSPHAKRIRAMMSAGAAPPAADSTTPR